jgi:hypothetical protein
VGLNLGRRSVCSTLGALAIPNWSHAYASTRSATLRAHRVATPQLLAQLGHGWVPTTSSVALDQVIFKDESAQPIIPARARMGNDRAAGHFHGHIGCWDSSISTAPVRFLPPTTSRGTVALRRAGQNRDTESTQMIVVKCPVKT